MHGHYWKEAEKMIYILLKLVIIFRKTQTLVKQVLKTSLSWADSLKYSMNHTISNASIIVDSHIIYSIFQLALKNCVLKTREPTMPFFIYG